MDLLVFDRAHLWHPCSSMTRPGAAFLVESAAGLEPFRDVRTLGAVGVVELDRPVDVPAVTRAALDAGVWVRPFRNLVYTVPPFVCTATDLAAIIAGMVAAVKEVQG